MTHRASELFIVVFQTSAGETYGNTVKVYNLRDDAQRRALECNTDEYVLPPEARTKFSVMNLEEYMDHLLEDARNSAYDKGREDERKSK